MKKDSQIKLVEKQLVKIAKHFNLRWDRKWFNYLFVPKEINIILEYLHECPDPDYGVYGKSRKKRIENLDKFVSSKTFKSHLKRWGGQVYDKKEFSKDKKLVNNIKDIRIKELFSNFLRDVDKKLNVFKQISLLTEPNNKKELKLLLENILRHEITHILFNQNNLTFQSKGKAYWKYDEGLVTYCDFLIEDKLDKFEEISNNPIYKGKMEYWYWSYGLKFKRMLSNKNSPLDRKMAIKRTINQLKIKK